MRNILIICLTLILTSCYDGTIVIADLSKRYEQKVVSKSGNPWNIKIKVTGESDGTYRVFGVNFKKGKVDQIVKPDAYLDTITLNYEPITAKKGKLVIKYDY